MHRTRHFSRRSALLLALPALATLAACSGDRAVAPDAGPPALALVSGSGQSGLAGRELPQPLVVRATDTQGRALPGVTVVYVVTQGGGTLYAAGVLTSTIGTARNFWTLGDTPGHPQAVEVRSVDPATGAKRVHGTFTAIGQ